jgi:hypothetical protein
MNWVKSAGTYTIGWSSTLSINFSALAAGASVQQWVSPRWLTSSATSYVNYYCSTATTAAVAPATTPTVSTSSTIGTSTVDLQSIGIGGTATASSTAAALTTSPSATLSAGAWVSTPTWTGTAPAYTFNC